LQGQAQQACLQGQAQQACRDRRSRLACRHETPLQKPRVNVMRICHFTKYFSTHDLLQAQHKQEALREENTLEKSGVNVNGAGGIYRVQCLSQCYPIKYIVMKFNTSKSFEGIGCMYRNRLHVPVEVMWNQIPRFMWK